MSSSGTLPGYQATAEFDNPRCGLLRSIHESHDIPKRPHAQPIARHLHREILLRPVELSPIDRRRIRIHLKLPQQRRGVRTTSTRLDSRPFARLIVPILTCLRALRWTASSDRVTLLGDRMPPNFPSVADAVFAAIIPVHSATYIVSALIWASPCADRDDFVAAELALVKFALESPADIVRVVAARWRDALDSDGIE